MDLNIDKRLLFVYLVAAFVNVEIYGVVWCYFEADFCLAVVEGLAGLVHGLVVEVVERRDYYVAEGVHKAKLALLRVAWVVLVLEEAETFGGTAHTQEVGCRVVVDVLLNFSNVIALLHHCHIVTRLGDSVGIVEPDGAVVSVDCGVDVMRLVVGEHRHVHIAFREVEFER